MRRTVAVVLSVAALVGCSSAKDKDVPASVIGSAAVLSPAPSTPTPPIPSGQDHRIRGRLLDLATAEETVFTDTGSYVAFQGAVPKVLTDAGFSGFGGDDVLLGASTPTKDTYCLTGVYRPTLAFELYHSEGAPGLAGSTKDIPADCRALVQAVVAKAEAPGVGAGT